jgi:hypothetical protein
MIGFHMLWLGLAVLVVVGIVLVAWRIGRTKVPDLGSVSDQWMDEQRRKY